MFEVKLVGLKNMILRIYNHNFTEIGFYIEYKNEILTTLANENNERRGQKEMFSGQKKYIKKKKKHKDESSEKIHSEIRGKHFNHFSQIFFRLQ